MCLFPLFRVTEFCDGFFFCSDWEFVEQQSFSFSRKRAHSWTVTQEDMRFEGSQAKAPPQRRRRTMLPTPLQNSYSSFEEAQGHFEVEDQTWSARDRTVIAGTKQYLEESKSLKIEVEELESLLGPDDSDVDFRRILEEARGERGCAIFETFSSEGPSEFLVIIRMRWDEHQRRLNAPWRQNSSASSCGRQWQAGLEEQRVAWSASERKVIGVVEDFLENVPRQKSGLEALERLMEPEDEEVSLKYILKYSTRRGSNIFQFFDTRGKKPFRGKQKGWLEHQGERAALQERLQNEWHGRCRSKACRLPGTTRVSGNREKTGAGSVLRSRRRPRES